MALGGGWYYNSVSGSIIDQPPLLGIPQSWFPDWHGPFPTKQAAIQYAQTHGGAQPGGLGQNVTNTVGAAGKNASQALSNGILPENWFMRAGEIAIGVILLAVGLNTLLKGTPVGDAAQTVTKAVVP